MISELSRDLNVRTKTINFLKYTCLSCDLRVGKMFSDITKKHMSKEKNR